MIPTLIPLTAPSSGTNGLIHSLYIDDVGVVASDVVIVGGPAWDVHAVVVMLDSRVLEAHIVGLLWLHWHWLFRRSFFHWIICFPT